MIVSLACLYNLWVIIYRFAFREIDGKFWYSFQPEFTGWINYLAYQFLSKASKHIFYIIQKDQFIEALNILLRH